MKSIFTTSSPWFTSAVTLGIAVCCAVATKVSGPTNCAPTPSGLVSWWRGENSTADAADGNNGTIAGTGTVTYGPGVVGQAFVFDGTHRDRVNVGNPINLRLEDFTIEAWVKRSSPTVTSFDVLGGDGSVAGDGGCIFGYGRGGYIFALANNGRMILSRTDLDGLLSAPLVTDTNWHHLAVTKFGTNAVFYLDGVAQATPAYAHPAPYTFDDGTCTCTAAASIGSRGDGRGGTFFGMIDEPAIYNRALATNEIRAIYNAGGTGKCQEPPVILTQPASQRVTLGSNVTFSVVASGTPQLRYQWRRNGDGVAGATSSAFSFTVGIGSGGLYSVRVTNAFGTVISSNGVLTVNTVPSAGGQNVSLSEDTPTAITLQGSDAESDPLTYLVVTPPAHGSLTGSAPNLTYTPAPNYFGPDSFSFKVNDGLVDSAPAAVSITILPVNDPPVAQSQSVSLDEDTTVAITLGAFDVDGDAQTYTVGAPAHGALSGAPPNLSYRPNSNYFGADSFTFSVSDGRTNSQSATVSITVRPVNDAPVARISVSPRVTLPGITNLVIIAANNINAEVVLDGSQSSDVENDPLTYTWLDGTNVLATTVITTNALDVGSHDLTLVVSDGTDSGTAMVTLEVITPAEAVGTVIAFIEESNLGRRNARPLIASLKAAAESFDAGNTIPALNQLQAFQKKVQAQIAPSDPALAQQLIDGAQAVINALSGP